MLRRWDCFGVISDGRGARLRRAIVLLKQSRFYQLELRLQVGEGRWHAGVIFSLAKTLEPPGRSQSFFGAKLSRRRTKGMRGHGEGVTIHR